VKLVHWLMTLPLAAVLIVFAVSNLDVVPVSFWPFAELGTERLGVIVLVALLAGFLAGEFVAWINGAGWRREARRRARRVEALERELLATQAQLPRTPSGLPVQHPTRD
jgi:putative membrane protein